MPILRAEAADQGFLRSHVLGIQPRRVLQGFDRASIVAECLAREADAPPGARIVVVFVSPHFAYPYLLAILPGRAQAIGLRAQAVPARALELQGRRHAG